MIKMKIGRLLPILFTLQIILAGCIDRLDFFGDTVEGELVIYGLLTDTDEPQKVTISRTNTLGRTPIGEDRASVVLLNERGNRFRYTAMGNGVYLLPDFKGVPGETYSLEVIVDRTLYFSSEQTMPTVSAQDSISFAFGREPFRTSVEEAVFTVSANSIIPEGEAPAFFRWTAEETYQWIRTTLPCTGLCPPPPDPCYISDRMDPNRINLFDGVSSRSREINQVVAKRVVDNSFLGFLHVSLKQHSITREAYEYWRRINLIVNNQGSLFDVPPAPVFGNFTRIGNPEEGVLGFFEVAKVSYTRKFVFPADVPFFLSRPCDFVVGRPAENYPSECIDCEARAGGRTWTTTAPEWWFGN